MLYLLEFPDLHMDELDDSEVEAHWSDTDLSASNTSPSQAHNGVNVLNRRWKVTTNLAPEDIWIEIRIDLDTHRYSVRLKKEGEISRFVWQE